MASSETQGNQNSSPAEDVSNVKKSDVQQQPFSNELKPAIAEDETKQSNIVSLKKLEAVIDELDDSELAVPECKETLGILKQLQYEHVCIEEAYRREWSEMKLRYLEKFRPLYRKRWSVLTGRTEEEFEKTESFVSATKSPTSSSTDIAVDSTGTSKLPKFWLKAMKNHPLLDEMIEESDIAILEYLEDIRFKWVDSKDQTSFCLNFIFAQNPYFTNTVLSKTYYLEPSDENNEETVLTRTVGTEINWNAGKNVTEKTVVRKQRNKRTNATRVVSDIIRVNSFFNFFKTYEIPAEEQLEQLSEEDVSEIEMILEAEFELGAVLRDKIIPRALGWFLGVEHDDLQSEDVNMDDFEEENEESEEFSDEKD